MQLTDAEKNKLLEYGRAVLVGIVKNGNKIEQISNNKNFAEKAGVFVSLRTGDELRGCIGYIEPIESIWNAVRDNTISAATNDIRFLPVAPAELAAVKIEISILTPPVECQIEDIKTGEDGVIVQQGAYKATYLPQVWEHFQNRESFFNSLCLKGGLNENAWKNKQTKFLKYKAIVFAE